MNEPHQPFDRTADHPVLDFANTVEGRAAGQPVDRLARYADVVEFARQTGLVPEEEARTLARAARRHPEAAERARTEAVALREALHRLFTDVAEGREPAAEALFTFNAFVSRLRIGPDLSWAWQAGGHGLDAPLGPVVRGALELLDPARRGRIGVCGNPSCRFLYLDTSKNRSRRWCEMETCGNRMKARRHYHRARDAATGGEG